MHIKDIIRALFPIVRFPLRYIAICLDWLEGDSYKQPHPLARLNEIHEDVKGSCLIPKVINKQAYDLDIIVPCYNVEKYVAACIESILYQSTSFSFRVILIDDGSTDKTGAIVDSYAKDNRVVIMHKSNEGLGAARNTGLQLLNSRYVMFVDSDDMLAENAIETLMASAYKEQKKIINGNFVYIDEANKIVRNNQYSFKAGSVKPKADMQGFAWGKIYASELFAGIGFPKGYLFEDTVFRKVICCLTEEGHNKDAVVYKYRYRSNSISAAVQANARALDSLYVYLQLYKDCETLELPFEQSDYEYLLEHVIYTAFRCKHLPIKVQKLVFQAWRDFVLQEAAGFHSQKPTFQQVEQSLAKGNFWSYWVTCVFNI